MAPVHHTTYPAYEEVNDMANQMIALQSRNPQLPDPSRAAAQMANMMNMASQQRASQLQAERIRQEMEYAKAAEGRAVQTQAATMREKDLDIEDKELARLYKIGAALLETQDPTAREAGYQNLLGQIEKTSPQLGATMRQVAPTYNPNVLQSVMMETQQYFNKKYATPIASLEIREDGTPVSVQVGGLNPQQSPVYDAPPPMAAAPRATPTAPQAAAPQTPTSPDSARPLTPYQQDHIRRMQEELGMTNTPASFSPGASAGQMTPQRAQQIVDAAVNTRVMSQEDFDQLLALTPEQNKQPFMDMIRSNGITLQPGGMGQQPQFADLRGQRMQSQTAGLRGAPPMEQTLAQTQPRTVSKLRLRDPNQPIAPASSVVPLSRLRAEGVAGRESPAEAAAKAKATARATAAVDAEKKAAEKLPGRKQVSTIINKIRNAYEQLDKAQAIPSETRGGFANAMDYIASSSLGREAQKMVGTKSSKYLSEIINSRKLLATAIKNATGMSAQEMNSNVELQLTLDALTDPTQGIEAARSTLNTLEELYGVPASAPANRRTPTKSSSGWGTAKVVGN